MKKTIILTISMLAVFSVFAWVSANQLTNKWQTPQQDEIDLSVSSPVEMVEKEYKEYPYIINEESEYIVDVQENMVTYAEASSVMGTTLETILPTLDLSSKTATIGLYRYPPREDIFIYVMRYGEERIKDGNQIYISMNPYTDEIIFIHLYAIPEKEAETFSFVPPTDEKEFLNTTLSHLNVFGAEIPTKYIITQNSTNYHADENYKGKRVMFLADEYVSQIDWAYNEKENILFYYYGHDDGNMPILNGLQTESLKEHIKENGKDM